jgi:ArsR family transcriptional regulator
MSDIFDVIADEGRREILRILLERSFAGKPELSVSDLVAKTGLSQPTVSKQLKVLRESGLVGVREDGQHRLYHLDAAPLEQLEAWVTPFLGAGEVGAESAPSTAATSGESYVGEDVKDFAATVGRTAAEAVHQVNQLVDFVTRKLG